MQPSKYQTKQECIPVGCVPSAPVAISPGGRHPPPRSRHPPGADTHTPRADTPGADTPWEQTPPQEQTPSCGQTHACKNITFATLLRTVIMQNYSQHRHDVDILQIKACSEMTCILCSQITYSFYNAVFFLYFCDFWIPRQNGFELER